MRWKRLDLIAFGALRGVSLDLDAAGPCLHLVYGPNEAGKTTALRGLHGLLYGIPEKTPDDHSIKPSELRVGGLLCDAHGRELYVLRRKGRKHTLLARDGTPLEGAEAAWITAGIPEPLFRSLFALSYDTLAEGADELLGSAGELGRSLFSAGTGGVGAHAVLEALRCEADAIYRPRGRNQSLNEALSAFEQARRSVREQAIHAEAFTKQQRAIDEAEAEANRLTIERQRAYAERNRLERARRVLPLLSKRAELRRVRAELGDVVALAEDAAERRLRLDRARREAGLRAEHVERELLRLDEASRQIVAPDALLALDPAAMRELRDQLLHYRRGQRALPARRAALASSERQVHDMLARLGLAEDAAAAEGGGWHERFRISRPLEARIRDHAHRGEARALRLRDLERALAAKRDESALSAENLTGLRGPPAPARATAEAASAPAEPHIESERAFSAPFGAAAVTGAARAADSGKRVRAGAKARGAPRFERLEEFEQGFAALDRAAQLCAERRTEHERALERAACDLDALEQAGEPPSEAQLTLARERRAELALELVARLDRADVAGARVLAAELEALCRQADALADRLRREASRVADHARLRAAHAGSLRQLARLDQEAAQVGAEREALSEAWRALCAEAGVSTRAPAAMRAFLLEYRSEHARHAQLERECSTLARELAEEHASRSVWQSEWCELLAKLQLPAETTTVELEALLSGLADAMARLDGTRLERDALRSLELELTAFEQALRPLCERLLEGESFASLEQAAEALLERHQAACSGAERRAQLEAQRLEREVELREARAAHEEAERELAGLLAAARARDLSELELAEQRARRARELDVQLEQVQAELLSAADGVPLAQLEQELAGSSVSDTVARLDELAETLEALESAREDAVHTLESRRVGLARLRESHGAADAALDAGAELENVRALAQRYVRVRLALGVLSREVERYRERHKAPILRSASQLFAELTGRAWTGLDAELGPNDKPVLVCVRRDGERVSVLGLSAGTRDQLYLALRLASIERLAGERELAPLVMDDLLVHFDDERARAALFVLGGFAEKTQVLLFTHHTRVCELAREALSPDRLRIHRLGRQTAAQQTLRL